MLHGMVGVVITQIKMWLALCSIKYYTTFYSAAAAAAAAAASAAAAFKWSFQSRNLNNLFVINLWDIPLLWY